MLMRYLFLFGFIIVLSGCATSNKEYRPALEHCQNRVGYLEQEIKAKDREISSLEYDLKKKEAWSYRRAETPAQTNIEPVKGVSPTPVNIQKALKSAGYYKGPVDGKIGAKTQDAIIKFQKDNDLKTDGKVGSKTWAELEIYLD